MKQITPCLWFNNNAQEAMEFYKSVFKDFRVTDTQRYPNLPAEDLHGGKPGAVVTIMFEINGQPFMALNGGMLVILGTALTLLERVVPCFRCLCWTWQHFSARTASRFCRSDAKHSPSLTTYLYALESAALFDICISLCAQARACAPSDLRQRLTYCSTITSC